MALGISKLRAGPVVSTNAAETPKDEKKGDHGATKPDGYGYGYGSGYGDEPGYGGGGWGGYEPGYGGGGWGSGWRRGGCWWGCCGGRSFWGGGCRFCCRSLQEAKAYNMMMANADGAYP